MNEYRDKDEYRENLPVLARTEHTEYEAVCPQRRSRRGAVAAVCVALCVLITAICLTVAFFDVPAKTVQSADTKPSDEVSDEWKGAFAAKNIYENCYESSVTIRLGRDNESMFWSGFVIDSDGWIATSLDVMEVSKRGRMYVAFSDGKEYSVVSRWRDPESGIALLKISAESLNAVELREEDMQGGERVICVGALEYGSSCVASGEICGMLDERFKVNIGLDAHGTGAPLFDDDGRFVAMATADDFENGGRISYALSANKCKSVFEYIKNEKNK